MYMQGKIQNQNGKIFIYSHPRKKLCTYSESKKILEINGYLNKRIILLNFRQNCFYLSCFISLLCFVL